MHMSVMVKLDGELLREHAHTANPIGSAIHEVMAPFYQNTTNPLFLRWDMREQRMHNPNTKWDWWELGGRFDGRFPVKPGVGRYLSDHPQGYPIKSMHNIAKLHEIDMEKAKELALERAKNFFANYLMYADGAYMALGERINTVSEARAIGLLRRPKHKNDLPTSDEITLVYVGNSDDGHDGHEEYVKEVTEEAFFASYMPFFQPLWAHAALDSEGWHQCDEGSTWGLFPEGPAGVRAFKETFMSRFVMGTKPDDVFVMLDVHQ